MDVWGNGERWVLGGWGNGGSWDDDIFGILEVRVMEGGRVLERGVVLKRSRVMERVGY